VEGPVRGTGQQRAAGGAPGHGNQAGQQVAAPADLLAEGQQRSGDQLLQHQRDRVDREQTGIRRDARRSGDARADRDHRGRHPTRT
jgi:hypothetical protein